MGSHGRIRKDDSVVDSLISKRDSLLVDIFDITRHPEIYRNRVLADLGLVDSDDFSRVVVLMNHLEESEPGHDNRRVLMDEVRRSLPTFDGSDLEEHHRTVFECLLGIIIDRDLVEKRSDVDFFNSKIASYIRFDNPVREEEAKKNVFVAKELARSKERAKDRDLYFDRMRREKAALESDPIAMTKFLFFSNGIDVSNYVLFVADVNGHHGSHIAAECRDDLGRHYYIYPKKRRYRPVSVDQIEFYKRLPNLEVMELH